MKITAFNDKVFKKNDGDNVQYKVKIDAFEGPLDLLLHLIQRLEIDIYDIPVADITEQYMSYVHTLNELELDEISEYLVMAATLLAIKSQMLLPNMNHIEDQEENFDFEEEDPRDELVVKLLEYRKYKDAAVELKLRGEDRALIYSKPPSDLSMFEKDNEHDLSSLDVSMYDLLGAFHKLLRRKKLQKPQTRSLQRQEISIDKRMNELLTNLRKRKKRMNFMDLFDVADKNHVVITFLAVLELMKLNSILVEQEGNFEEIFVDIKKGAELVGSR
jgi:segregation and condensation protein A